MGHHLMYQKNGAIAVLYCTKNVLVCPDPPSPPNGIHPSGRPHLCKSVMTIVRFMLSFSVFVVHIKRNS